MQRYDSDDDSESSTDADQPLSAQLPERILVSLSVDQTISSSSDNDLASSPSTSPSPSVPMSSASSASTSPVISRRRKSRGETHAQLNRRQKIDSTHYQCLYCCGDMPYRCIKSVIKDRGIAALVYHLLFHLTAVIDSHVVQFGITDMIPRFVGL